MKVASRGAMGPGTEGPYYVYPNAAVSATQMLSIMLLATEVAAGV